MTSDSIEAGLYRRAAPRNRTELDAIPTPKDLERAAAVVRRELEPTPAEFNVELSRRFGRRIVVKLENCSPIRSFKARGALAALVARADECRHGVVTASTGNHGQGVAFAAARVGVSAAVAAPDNVDRVKLRAIRDLGATLLPGGGSLAAAEVAARRHADASGALYLEDGDDPWLMAGAATVTSELLEREPALDTIVVPVGGGNLVASALLAAHLVDAGVEVVGVQSSAATGVTRSWLEGRVVVSACTTFAGGVATARPGRASLAVLLAMLERMVVVDDDDLWRAIAIAYDAIGLPVEGAGAAGVAALERFGDRIPGERVGIVVSGGRIGADDLAAALSGRARHPVRSP